MRDQNDHGTLDLITGRMMLGYARVSTDDQDLTNQRAELRGLVKSLQAGQGRAMPT